MEEVKKELNKELKRFFELDILNLLKQGKNPSKISKELNISLPKISYYLHKLKEKKLIKRVGYGVWETSSKSTKDTIFKEVRGHAFMWKVKIPKEVKNWNKRIEILQKLNIIYKLVGLKQTPRIIINNRKIWLGNKNITIYENKSFLAINSIEARKYAVYELLTILEELELKLGINLKSNEGYLFTPRKEHYSLIKNQLAIQVRKSGEKLYCYDKSGTWWFCCDKSYNLDEAEFQTTKETNGLVQGMEGQKWFNSQRNTNWKVTPEFTLGMFNNLIEDRKFWAENQKSHVASIQELGKSVKKLTKVMKGILTENRDLKLKSKHQKKLQDFIK